MTTLDQSPLPIATQNSRRAPEAASLIDELEQAVDGEVRFDKGSQALYSRDASNYRQVPIGVVIPKTKADVVATVAACRRHGVPILARGGGTSLAGQCCNVAVVLDFSKYMNKVLEIDAEQRVARVQPGLILDHLRRETEKHNLTFGPDPATHNRCTLGGMIGNNSCGIHSVMAGRTADNVEELEILLYDGTRLTVGQTSPDELDQIVADGGRRGEIYQKLKTIRDENAELIRQRYPDIPRRVSGYNLPELLQENHFNVARALVGSECTCCLVLEAKVRLVHDPPYRSLAVVGYPDIYTAGDHVCEIMDHGPIGLEGIDHHLIRYMKTKGLHSDDAALLPDGRGWLIVEFGGDTQQEADEKAERLRGSLHDAENVHVKIYEDRDKQQHIWEVRESGLGATAFVPGEHDSWPGWEDAAVAPQRIGDYLRDFRELLDKFGYGCSLYGHFGQGCVHTRIDFELKTADGLANYRRFVEEAANLVLSYNGSFSGEHGDGQSRAELLPKMYGGKLMQVLREFKSIWDPDWKMNPGKVIDPDPLDSNLALGTDYHPAHAATHFRFPDDHGSFAHATLRCVGVGKCRRTEGGLMCPSYMVTRDEEHTTRGRAHMLYEMLQGDVIDSGFQSEEVKDALDLCLACKGCKSDCPVNVDMATYKAEFLSHYYEKHRRPITAYSMGWIHRWARLASLSPGIANWISHAPLIGNLFKWMGGVASERDVPRFADESFQTWFARREPRNVGRNQVILWPDTFNNYFHPEVAKAAVRVLEHAGWHVRVPRARMCCGRPLYDYGMLPLAKKMLSRIVAELRPEIRRGVCVVGLEPSCVAVFRDELANLYPDDEDAMRLSHQTYDLSDFLIKRSPEYNPPTLRRRAIVHGHCHHRSIMGMEAEEQLLQKLGLELEMPDSGCCGIAGSFGFEAKHYDISVACGERVLLPAIRAADNDYLVIANGFSCKEQIRQQTDRRALHLAEVLALAIDDGQHRLVSSRPERAKMLTQGAASARARAKSLKHVAFVGGALAGLGLMTYLMKSRGR